MSNTELKDQGANYDRKLVSAETAARIEREGENFKGRPDATGGIDTTKGYTVDREGLSNNFAIEPEMYVEEPGDLREKQEAEAAQKAAKRAEVNTPGGRGPGVI
ncbi:MAG: hypothetical protein ACPGVO_05920 [Spirulinaceae cyanobacterium]